ncbi:MAG TPA: TonB-dependent receptor [Methylomirabilota bacterium]|nr:TonB-dependent receptor [Methylomirabilota bacterium]
MGYRARVRKNPKTPTRVPPPWLPVLALVVFLTSAPVAAQQQPSPPAESDPPPVTLPPVVVIGTTPVPALGIPIDKYAGNVQSLTGDDVKRRGGLDASELLYRRVGSVNINGGQSNPWQNDLTYRGFLASPLTGSAIGLSMYLDGMRFNDGFGDTLNWDLIPRSAISGIDVIPGSNPLFGLNTLGGALVVHTKRGFDNPGASLDVSGGSFGRWDVNAEYGGFHGPFDWFLTFNALDENGWRQRSPSELRQLFGKVGYKTDRTDLELSYAYADNDLTGNGPAPESLLARHRRAVYTFPDETENRMHLVNLRGSQWLTDKVLVSGNTFYRHYRRATTNGDVEVDCVEDATGSAAFTPGGQAVHLGNCQGSAVGFVDADGNPLAGTLQRAASGAARQTRTVTQDWGATLQLSHRGKIFGFGNRATVGVAYDGHRSTFSQSDADADLVPDGASVGVEPSGPFEKSVDVLTEQRNIGAYVTDTFEITEQLALTVGGRYQHARIQIRDQSGLNPDVDGRHSFERFNPAVGLTFKALPTLTLFGSYSEGFRAPTAAELTCADPSAPCNLPNAFLADPPLKPVIARTYEFGARGKIVPGEALGWNVAFFRTDLTDDILFTQTATTGSGFFRNVAATRRQGVETGVQGSLWNRLHYYLAYALVQATYETDVTLASVTQADGVTVKRGDTIPGVPLHNIKLGGEVAVLPNFWVGADVVSVSGSYLRGDDGNHQPKVPGYTVLNLSLRYSPVKHVEVWGRVDNVTDAHYRTAGALNWNAFVAPISAQRFVAPGAPIGGWAGVRLRF